MRVFMKKQHRIYPKGSVTPNLGKPYAEYLVSTGAGEWFDEGKHGSLQELSPLAILGKGMRSETTMVEHEPETTATATKPRAGRVRSKR
jgi:hypothetical protein